MHRWQHISTKRPRAVIVVFALVMSIVGWYAFGLFDGLSSGNDSFYAEGTESKHAASMIQREFGSAKANDIILFERRDDSLGDASSQAYQSEVARILEPLRSDADEIITYRDQPSDRFISKDKHATYAVVSMKSDESSEVYERLDRFQRQTDQSKLSVFVGGAHVGMEQTQAQVSRDLLAAEMITLPILLVLLLIFFRGIVAALVPLGISLLTVVGAFAIARFVNGFVPIDSYAVNVITILGLGLSIDYALLVVNRFREELAVSSVDDAVRTVVATACRTVFFSGITVIACLLALLVFPVEFLRSIAIGGASAVAMAIIVTVVVVPSLLTLLGVNIDKWRIRDRRNRSVHQEGGVWWRIAHLSARHPFRTLIVALAVVAVAISPVKDFAVGTVDYAWLARGQSAQYVGEAMNERFEGVSGTSAQVMVSFPASLSRIELIERSCAFTERLEDMKGVASVISPTPVGERLSCSAITQMVQYDMLSPQLAHVVAQRTKDSALLFDASLSDNAGTDGAARTVELLRALEVSDGYVVVAGEAAAVYDTNRAYLDALPYALLVIGISMMMLLSLLLRSVVLPLQAVVINTIALGISLGMIIGFFQFGWLREVTHFAHVNGLDLSAPILVMAIAFGLAMDYSVFLYSRMREAYDTSHDPVWAVEQGVIKTGPIVTAAALVLFVVVVAFAGSSVGFMQIIGFGLAIAVLVDAFFVRLVLVPAIMRLMGHTSWYAPKWLYRWRIRHD